MKTLHEEFKLRWPKLFENVECGFYLPPEWKELVWSLCESIEEEFKEDLEKIKVVQVKEKFGGLRFYIKVTELEQDKRDKLHKLIEDAEADSFSIKE